MRTLFFAGLMIVAFTGDALAQSPPPPLDLRFTKPDGTVSTDPTSVYGPIYTIVGVGNGSNTFYASNWNERVSPNNEAYPTAVTGHSELHSVGGASFAGYFEAQSFTSGVSTTEIDAFNRAGADAPATYPWNRAIGSQDVLPIAITCAAGTSKTPPSYKAAACMEVASEGGTGGQFQFGLTFAKGAVVQAGIYMDADATLGPKNNLVLRNTGQNGAVPIILKTMGATNTAPSIQHEDVDGNVNWSILNDGAASFSSFAQIADGAYPDLRWRNASAATDMKNWSIYTDPDGIWHLRTVNDGYTAASDAMVIRRSGLQPSVAEFGIPIRLRVTTVAGLPGCTGALQGAMVTVTDAGGTVNYRSPITGGGATVVPAFCDGSTWTAH